jgi:hypothetical protein
MKDSKEKQRGYGYLAEQDEETMIPEQARFRLQGGATEHTCKSLHGRTHAQTQEHHSESSDQRLQNQYLHPMRNESREH